MTMPSDAPLAAVVANLDARIAVHREREAFHAEQENLHRHQRELHAAELEVLEKNLAAFREAAAAVLDLANRDSPLAPPPQPAPEPDPDPGRRPRLSRMVDLVLASWPPGQPFGLSHVAAEIGRRYGNRLRKPVDSRMVSVHLRRRLADGRLVSIEKGRPHHQALYARPA
jgi:hypothetical protein